jgi:predicted TPR repeat methyltransferase
MDDTSTKLQEVTLDEAMTMAIAFQRRGQLAEAEQVYRKVFEVVPDHPVALHYAGVLAHQQGRSEEGVALVQHSITIDPDRADWYNNLGIILRALGRLDEAVAAYRQAIAVDPAHANAHSNLGVILRAQGHVSEAEAAYRNAIRLNPDHIDAYHNLGVLLSGLKRHKEAVFCYCKVTTLSPRHPEARRLLALAYRTLGENDKALEIFEEWLAEEPDNPVAEHMRAACSGRDVPSRASDAYVEKVFDDFASSFDAKLAHLSYQAPQLVAAMLADSGLQPAKSLDVLDAGCGTGLCGPLISAYARRLIGVDLSGRMLAQAREKGVYDELVKGELTTYLQQYRGAFDVIISADTLVYFGALDDVFAAAAAALRSNGVLIFSVEEATDTRTSTYAIESHGRYGHARRYLEEALAQVGFRAQIVRAELRMESGAPVDGLVVRAVLG